MFNRFLHALQFLTVLPVPTQSVSDDTYHQTMGWYPAAGIVIGLMTAGVYWLMVQKLPVQMSVLTALFFQFFMTGGLHLDGLADTFDGCMSGRDRIRKLEIMKDSRLGTHGALILLFVLLFKLTAYTALPDHLRIVCLILAPVTGRLALVLGAWKGVYARENGLGNLFIGKITLSEVFVALGVCMGALAVTRQIVMGFALLAILVTVVLGRYIITRLLGGMTGDTLGALSEMSEVVFLMVVLLTC
ncbi:adenosylcobinamide-GDP ribazoletransferase [Anoxynatronum buryatiense]|uniref:Adenosylcobinamide-GDP ribazoletransferase n=1 Tax=Anoxynatronum buryatiense TaxID=489973 RepID=A0AA46AHE6_9CLOT|nr:adenosylcobinamide-GDP ribazoletransferase [Anoxynatronum buryatiense]SMP39094.1 cobalamin-5'-phosphate synthase [Anoxynatronum buryatiense]